MDGWKMYFLFSNSPFSGAMSVSFREGTMVWYTQVSLKKLLSSLRDPILWAKRSPLKGSAFFKGPLHPKGFGVFPPFSL